jgi:hypothetical protein
MFKNYLLTGGFMEKKMNNSAALTFEVPFKRMGIENKKNDLCKQKLLPPKEKYYINKCEKENEWQQEYFIIYNSYTLDKK